MKTVKLLSCLWLFACLPLTASGVEAWQVVGPGKYNFMGRWGNQAMAVDASGNIYIAGNFTDANGNYYVAKWNGSTWSQLGTGANGLNVKSKVLTLATDASGNVYAAGAFKNGTPRNNYYVSKWDGTQWQEIRNDSSYLKANAAIRTIAVDGAGNVYAAGDFTYDVNPSVGNRYVAVWDGKKWAELGGTASLRANRTIKSIACDPAGNVYAAGAFRDTNDMVYVAKFDGASWSQLGTLVSANDPQYHVLFTVVTDKVGNVYTAGTITSSTGVLYVARWNGTAWSEVASPTSNLGVVPTGNNAAIITIAVTPNGSRVYAAGTFPSERTRVIMMKWDGLAWSELGKAPYNLTIGRTGTVWQLAVNTSGEVIAAGDFTDINDICYVAKCGNYNLAVPGAGAVPTGSVQVYPNPAGRQMTVSGQCRVAGVGQPINITLMNMLGQVVYVHQLKPMGVSWSLDIPVGNKLPDAVYRLQVSSGDMKYNQPVVIRGGD